MDREAWQAVVHGGHKESDSTKQLKLFKDSERADTVSTLKLFTVLQKKHKKWLQ